MIVPSKANVVVVFLMKKIQQVNYHITRGQQTMAHRSNLAHCLFLYGKLMVFTLKWWGVGERNSKEEHTYDAQGRYEIQVSVCTNQV